MFTALEPAAAAAAGPGLTALDEPKEGGREQRENACAAPLVYYTRVVLFIMRVFRV